MAVPVLFRCLFLKRRPKRLQIVWSNVIHPLSPVFFGAYEIAGGRNDFYTSILDTLDDIETFMAAFSQLMIEEDDGRLMRLNSRDRLFHRVTFGHDDVG